MAQDFFLEIREGNVTVSIGEFLKGLLQKGLVEGLLVPREMPDRENVVQSLITAPVDGLSPLAPVMPVNSATIVSNMTAIEPSDKRIAVVLKPCEIRALIELVKLMQASLENLVIIGVDCPGTFSVQDYKEKINRKENPIDEVINGLKDNREISNLRVACRVCEYPVPQNCDITIGLFGMEIDKRVLLEANTATGEEILKNSGLSAAGDITKRGDTINELIKKRLEARDRLFVETQNQVSGLDNLSKFFATCIGCHNCMKVCPICYCNQCLFESTTFEYEFNQYYRQAKRKKAVRMPVDTVLFHLGRMNHMVSSCVDCGMCEQACPSKIELLKIFKFVGDSVKKVFDYVPGRDLKEELPVATFKEEELEPR